MSKYDIRQVFEHSYDDYCSKDHYLSDIQSKTAHSILNCKTGTLGYNLSQCSDCGHIEIHNNSCRNRNCPSCQAVNKEIWVDKRRAEVIDSPYFHVVFTLPHELNSLIYCNQKILYGLLHRCCAETLLELSADKKWLGATPGIIQVLHTWNQEIDYHVHMHCIVSGGGLTKEGKIRKSSGKFFIRTEVLREKDWCPYIKETFNGFGNAIEYLGRYTHKIAISNSRILDLTENEVTFSAGGKKPGDPKRQITLKHTEFIRRYLMHVLPSGFQKIRYYGFLNNRMKYKNLKVIFKLQNGQRFKQRFVGMTMAELIKAVWNFDICICPKCGKTSMKQLGRCYAASS